MLRTTLFAAAAAAFLFVGSASAQKLDANGRCHDASGKFAKAEVCGGASKAAPATKTASAKAAKSTGAASATAAATPASATAKATTAKSSTAKTASAKCKNAKGKYAKCGSPGATPA